MKLLITPLSIVLMLLMAPSSSYALSTTVLPSLAPVIKRVNPGVVNISVRGSVQTQQNPIFQDPFFRRFFDIPEQPVERRTQSVGSGVVIDAKKGYIITNHHVVFNADEITINFTDNRSIVAELVGSDPEADVAVLKVDAKNLVELEFGDSSQLEVGNFVIAIGNPFGLGQTATLGIVSALGRSGLGIEGYENFIQTDASINPGNSGGALIDQSGKLIGINTAILSRTGGNMGIGFAIPANMVKDLVNQLIEHGEVRRGQLGVSIQDLTSELAAAFGLNILSGAVISDVLDGSPADDIGLKQGDVIVSVDGHKVNGAQELRNLIGLRRPEDSVQLDVISEGKRKSLKAKLSERTGDQRARSEVHPALEGLELSDIPTQHPLFGQTQGIMVRDVERNSSGDNAGLRAGDIITSVNRQSISTIEEFSKVITDVDESPLLLNVRRGQSALFIVLR